MERGGALCASLLFHVLLLFVLGSSTSFDIRLGEKSRFDVIFWLSPSSFAAQGEEDLPLQKPAVTPEKKAVATLKPRAAAAAPAQQPPPRLAGSASRLPPNAPRLIPNAPQVTASAPRQAPGDVIPPTASPQPAGPAQKETPPDATLLLASAAKPAPAPAAVKEAKAPSSDVQTMEPPAKRVVPRPEPERIAPEALHMPVRLGAFREAGISGEEQTSGSNAASAAVAARKERSQAAAAANSARASAAAERSEESPQGAGRALSAGAPAQSEHPPSVKNGRVAEKHHESRGIVATSLQGDLKMIISGGDGVRLLVTFREFPKSRRNRPLTRYETRREQRIQPLIARTDQETREAVVQTARDGIYIFAAEPEQGEKAHASFTLKVVESGGRERTAEIGARTLSGKAVLARVLMRDGIFWDDDSAFTGRMDDSEGTTKYNANTGLYWKEFHH